MVDVDPAVWNKDWQEQTLAARDLKKRIMAQDRSIFLTSSFLRSSFFSRTNIAIVDSAFVYDVEGHAAYTDGYHTRSIGRAVLTLLCMW